MAHVTILITVKDAMLMMFVLSANLVPTITLQAPLDAVLFKILGALLALDVFHVFLY